MTHRKGHPVRNAILGAVALGLVAFGGASNAHGQDKPDLAKGKYKPAAIQVAQAEQTPKIPLMISQLVGPAKVVAGAVTARGPNPELDGLEKVPLATIKQLIKDSAQYVVRENGSISVIGIEMPDGIKVSALVDVSKLVLVIYVNNEGVAVINLNTLKELNGGSLTAVRLFFDFDDNAPYDTKSGYRVGVNAIAVDDSDSSPKNGAPLVCDNVFTKVARANREVYQVTSY